MDSLLNSDEKSLRLTTNEDLWCIFIITSCIQGHLIGDMQVDCKGGISLESKPLFLIIILLLRLIMGNLKLEFLVLLRKLLFQRSEFGLESQSTVCQVMVNTCVMCHGFLDLVLNESILWCSHHNPFSLNL